MWMFWHGELKKKEREEENKKNVEGGVWTHALSE